MSGVNKEPLAPGTASHSPDASKTVAQPVGAADSGNSPLKSPEQAALSGEDPAPGPIPVGEQPGLPEGRPSLDIAHGQPKGQEPQEIVAGPAGSPIPSVAQDESLVGTLAPKEPLLSDTEDAVEEPTLPAVEDAPHAEPPTSPTNVTAGGAGASVVDGELAVPASYRHTDVDCHATFIALKSSGSDVPPALPSLERELQQSPVSPEPAGVLHSHPLICACSDRSLC